MMDASFYTFSPSPYFVTVTPIAFARKNKNLLRVLAKSPHGHPKVIRSPQSHPSLAAVCPDAHPDRPDGADHQRPLVGHALDAAAALAHSAHASHVVLHSQLAAPERLVATAEREALLSVNWSLCLHPALFSPTVFVFSWV